jgi:hypothetical protein
MRALTRRANNSRGQMRAAADGRWVAVDGNRHKFGRSGHSRADVSTPAAVDRLRPVTYTLCLSFTIFTVLETSARVLS